MSITRYAKILVCFTLENRKEDVYKDIDEYPVEFQFDDIDGEVSMFVMQLEDADILDKGFTDSEAFFNVLVPDHGEEQLQQIEKRIEDIILKMGHNAKILPHPIY
jgi:hypothetical protein